MEYDSKKKKVIINGRSCISFFALRKDPFHRHEAKVMHRRIRVLGLADLLGSKYMSNRIGSDINMGVGQSNDRT